MLMRALDVPRQTPAGLALAGLAVALLALGLRSPAAAATFHSRDSALELAFPEADQVSRRDLILTAGEADRVRELAGARLESSLVTVYEGRLGGRRLGWAFLETHVVRTSPETVLIVLSPEGHVAGVHLVAFHEPVEYQAPPRWLEQFRGRGLGRDLAVGRDVDGITGATLTSRAVTVAVRRALAVWSVELSSRPGGDAS